MEYVVRYDSLEEKRRLGGTLEKLGFDNIHQEQFGYLEGYGAKCLCINTGERLFYPINITCAAAACSCGLRFYSTDEFELLAESGFTAKLRTPVFHVPHCGCGRPEELMESVCIPESEFLVYQEKMEDSGVMSFIPHQYYHEPYLVRADVSRLLCDVERFVGPEEPMERYGMGFCYERAYDGRVIKNVTPELRERTLSYYWKHHAKLDETVSKLRSVIMIDLHSFSEDTVVQAETGARAMPEICIGADSRYTHPRLEKAAVDIFTDAGFSVEVNYPYNGLMVPNAILKGNTDCDFLTLMVEVNKAVYLDGNGEIIESARERVQEALKRIICASHGIGRK